jgi:hypothetical protein
LEHLKMPKDDGLLEGIDDDPVPDPAISCLLIFEAAALALLLGLALTWIRLA